MGNCNEFIIDNGVLTGYSGCDSIIEIPEGVTEISTDKKYGVFGNEWGGKIKVEKVILPSSLKVIGKNAFRGCVCLTEITLHNGIEEIGEYAFDNCIKLKAISIPGTVKKIADNAFIHCVCFSFGIQTYELIACNPFQMLIYNSIPNSQFSLNS